MAAKIIRSSSTSAWCPMYSVRSSASVARPSTRQGTDDRSTLRSLSVPPSPNSLPLRKDLPETLKSSVMVKPVMGMSAWGSLSPSSAPLPNHLTSSLPPSAAHKLHSSIQRDVKSGNKAARQQSQPDPNIVGRKQQVGLALARNAQCAVNMRGWLTGGRWWRACKRGGRR